MRETIRYRIRELKSMSGTERMNIIASQGSACRICGHRIGLEVHHIEGEYCDQVKEVFNNPKNLIVVCHHCHSGLTTIELHYPALYQSLIKPDLQRLRGLTANI